ncbi:MAG: DUF2970 domain-containing protein [Comamonas sp.]|nr:DUF2970 domain-containing protein [Comamonas sp.]
MSTDPRPTSSFWRSFKALAWALLGVRKGSEWHKDAAHIKPLHIVLVGVVAIFAFVLLLIWIVNWVV